LKRIRIVQIVSIALIMVYITLLIVDIAIYELGDWKDLAFTLLLAGIAVNMIFKGVLIKSQSTMWFAVTLALSAITLILFVLNGEDGAEYYYIFSFLPIISSVINLAIFGNLIYIKVIILNISIIVPIILSYFVAIEILTLVVIGVCSVVVGISICRLIRTNKENV